MSSKLLSDRVPDILWNDNGTASGATSIIEFIIEEYKPLIEREVREQVINELVGWMEELSGYCDEKASESSGKVETVLLSSQGRAFKMCIIKAKSLLNQQGEETKLNP